MPRDLLRDIALLHQDGQPAVGLSADGAKLLGLYEAFLSATPDFVYVFGFDYRVLYANDALLTMWGRDREAAIGRTLLEVGYPAWHAAMHEREIDEVRATKQAIRGVVPFDGAHGRRQYEYIFVPVLGLDGEVLAVAGTTRDITDRISAEEQLTASEARQRFLVRLSDSVRQLSDPARVQAEASRLLGEHLGANRVVYFDVRGDEYVVEQDYTHGVPSVVGRHATAAFGAEQLEAYRAGRTVVEADLNADETRSAAVKHAFAALGIGAAVGVPLVKDGAFVAGLSVHSAVPREWTAHEIAIVEEAAERTWAAVERARVEAALRQSEERSAFVRQSSGVGFWYCDLPFDVLQWDERVKAHFHLPPDATVTIGTFYERIHPEDREPTRQAIERSIADRTPYTTDYRTVHPDTGAVTWVRAIGRTFYAPDGTPTQFDGVTLDVTDQKQAEANQNEFLAILAHELRNPLAPIRNGLHVMRLSEASGPVADLAAMMERQLTHLVRLVDDLLDVSRVRSDKVALRRETITIGTVIETAVETSRPLIDAQGHTLQIVVPDAPLLIEGDPTRLAQVVANLLNNSAKYTNRGGRITVTVWTEHDMACISVADDGIGIPPAMLTRVFERFTQVDRSLEKTTGGLGIGLSLVQGLIELHGGRVEARSEGEGRGSEFVVRLPLVKAHASATDMPTSHGIAPPSGRRRILIADDNVDAAESLAMLLELQGHDVVTAHDGRQAVEIAETMRPAVLLLDIAMPGLNGNEVARLIRASDWGRSALLVAVTGWGQQDRRDVSAHAGFDHYLVKPLDMAMVSRVIDAVGAERGA